MDKSRMCLRISVEQVRDGISYKGVITFDDISFLYTLETSTPLGEFDGLLTAESDAATIVKRICTLAIKKSAKADTVALTDEEREGLLFLIFPHVGEFYTQPQTRDSNSGPLGEMLRGESALDAFGASASISTERSGTIDRTPFLEKFLSHHAS